MSIECSNVDGIHDFEIGCLSGWPRHSPVAVCRREGISANIYSKWLKDFMEAGKSRLKGDEIRDATRGEVQELKRENERLKLLVAELSLDNMVLKKSLL